MTDGSTICGVCSEEFNQNSRCPRILGCFHTLCTDCIGSLIRSQSKQCPFCRMNFTAVKARDVTVNRTMLELMKYVCSEASQETHSFSGSGLFETSPHNRRIDTLKKETVLSSGHLLNTCQEAQKKVEQAINEAKDLNSKYCQENAKIDIVLLPKIKSISSQNSRSSMELDKTTDNLNEKLKEVKEKQRQLEELKGKLEAATSFREAAAIMDVAEETNITIKEWIANFKEFITEEERVLEASQQEIQVTKKKIDIMVQAASSEGGPEQNMNIVQDTRLSSLILFMVILNVFFSVWPRAIEGVRYLSIMALVVCLLLLPWKWRSFRQSASRFRRELAT